MFDFQLLFEQLLLYIFGQVIQISIKYTVCFFSFCTYNTVRVSRKFPGKETYVALPVAEFFFFFFFFIISPWRWDIVHYGIELSTISPVSD